MSPTPMYCHKYGYAFRLSSATKNDSASSSSSDQPKKSDLPAHAECISSPLLIHLIGDSCGQVARHAGDHSEQRQLCEVLRRLLPAKGTVRGKSTTVQKTYPPSTVVSAAITTGLVRVDRLTRSSITMSTDVCFIYLASQGSVDTELIARLQVGGNSPCSSLPGP